MGLAGHCLRQPELAAHDTILWEPTHGTARKGRRQTMNIDTLRRDVGLSDTGELRILITIMIIIWEANHPYSQPKRTNQSFCQCFTLVFVLGFLDDADYVSTYYFGDYLMMADSFSYAVKEGALEGTAIFSVSKGDCIPTSVTFMGAQQGTPVLEVAGFVNYTYGIQNPAKYFTIPDYCSQQASSPEPRQYNSFIHRFF
ncbi:uncharacterized protein LOC119730043 [Patiria miniata]|uniref:Uncharacterized protein n=1 Tax=Patiria miniata TaxID=46514 RepID=A0A914A4W0_PATMI|nr:uncharacterized protein LOC119730043 [Patiria miniata]